MSQTAPYAYAFKADNESELRSVVAWLLNHPGHRHNFEVWHDELTIRVNETGRGCVELIARELRAKTPGEAPPEGAPVDDASSDETRHSVDQSASPATIIDASMPAVERRLRRFIEEGYRPSLKSHLVWGEPREGWAILTMREWIRTKEGTGSVRFLSDPEDNVVGWSVDAHSVRPDEPSIHGGVFKTVDEALTDSERELEKILARR